jgi:hypothetical protein
MIAAEPLQRRMVELRPCGEFPSFWLMFESGSFTSKYLSVHGERTYGCWMFVSSNIATVLVVFGPV